LNRNIGTGKAGWPISRRRIASLMPVKKNTPLDLCCVSVRCGHQPPLAFGTDNVAKRYEKFSFTEWRSKHRRNPQIGVNDVVIVGRIGRNNLV
jgi:hypothetical protein